MNRFAFSLGLAITLAIWADAQNGPPAPIAADHLRQFNTNQALLTNLVDHTVELANAGGSLQRAEACHRVMTDLSNAMSVAVTAQDSPRVAELNEHISNIVNDALVPSLRTAKRDIPTTSPDVVKLTELHTQASNDMVRIEGSIPQIGTLGSSVLVKDSRTKLESAQKLLANALK
ncbi:hypothetical protein BH11PLA2_BH11PLA2_20300 [soil metagenome]